MASPLYDALNVQHSKNIGDAVAAAATDGSSWSSAQRDFHFNQASRRWLDYRILAGKKSGNWYPLKDYVQTGSQSLSGSVKTLSSWTGGVAHILSVYNTTDAVIVIPVSLAMKEIVTNAVNQFMTASTILEYYDADTSYFRLIGGTATSSIKLNYIQQSPTLVAGGTSETLIVPSEYWNELIDLADAVAFDERADQASVQRAAMLRQKVESLIGITNA